MNALDIVVLVGAAIVAFLAAAWATMRVLEVLDRHRRRRAWERAHPSVGWTRAEVTDNGDGTSTVHVDLLESNSETIDLMFGPADAPPIDPATLDMMAEHIDMKEEDDDDR